MTDLICTSSKLIPITIVALVFLRGAKYFVDGAYLLMTSGGNSQKVKASKNATIKILICIALIIITFIATDTFTSSIYSSAGATQVGQAAGPNSTSNARIRDTDNSIALYAFHAYELEAH